MKTLHRYVFGSFLTSFFLAFLVLSFVLTIGLMVQIVRYILTGVPIELVGEFALVCIPETMQWTIPLALLVSSVLVFSRMSADSEIAALRACGVNLLSVIRWPLIFAYLMSLLGLYINNEIVPRGHEIRRTLAKKITVGSGLELLEPGRVIDDFPKMKLYFSSKEGNWLHNLIVLDYSNPKFVREITARKALVSSEDRALCLDLYNLTVDPMDEDHPGMARAARYQHRIEDVLKSGKYHRKEKDFRFFEMLSTISQVKEKVKSAQGNSVKGTEKYMYKCYLSDIQTEFQKRWVFAFASICLVLVGIPLGIRAQRKESSIGMAISLVVALSYYLVIMLMLSLSTNFKAQPEFLIWLPVLACALLASYLIPKNL
jgi:lipopolysaccharide export system permease protein